MISYEEYENNRTSISYLSAEPEDLDDTIRVSGSGYCYDLDDEFGTSDFNFEYDYFRDEMTITVEKQLDEDERENEYDDTETVELDEWEYENLFNKLKGELYFNPEVFEDVENFVSVCKGDVTTERIDDPKYLTVHGEFKCGNIPFEFVSQTGTVADISFTNINNENCPAPPFVFSSCDLRQAIEQEYEAHDIEIFAKREDDKILIDFNIGTNWKQNFEGVCTLQKEPVITHDPNEPEVTKIAGVEYSRTLEIEAVDDGVFAEPGKVDINTFKPDVRDAIYEAIDELDPYLNRENSMEEYEEDKSLENAFSCAESDRNDDDRHDDVSVDMDER